MAEYREIQGAAVQSLANNTGTIEGQIWYDTTNNKFKVEGVSTAAWATVAVLPYTTRDASGFGTQTAGVIFGGFPGVSTAVEWNGSSYTSATAYPASVSGLDSDGPQIAGLTAGGSPGPMNNTSNDYNGTAWTANPTMPVGRTGHATMGNTAAQTAALATGGEPGSATGTTSDWDGSTWTVGAANPGWAQGTSGGGTPAAAFVNADVNDGDKTHDYDGTSWTSGNNSNNQHNYGGAGGLATVGITFGGTQVPNPGVRTAQAERYDGTCWTTDASMNEATSNSHGKCTVSGPAILAAGGNPGPPGSSNASEEYTGAGPASLIITTT